MKNTSIIPCTECRKHHRKCMSTFSNKCSRCEKLGRECILPTEELVVKAKQKDARRKELQQQIIQLEWTLQQVQKQLQYLDSGNNNLVCQVMIENMASQWEFQIKNGSFHIETGIKNISDLLLFQSNITYLSPLGSYGSVSSDGTDDSDNESEIMMHFGSTSSETLLPFTLKLLKQCAKIHFSRTSTTLLLPSILLFNSTRVIDQIIYIYFSCHNAYTPLLHERSFMEKYKRLDNPMTDLISISVCAFVCVSPCDHLNYTAREKKKMADFFFTQAKSIILDQFDLPEKRLENVMSINLLSKYMHMTLKYHECQRLIDIAYQICLDLKEEFKSTFYDGLPCCTSASCIKPDCKLTGYSPEEELKQILYSRHASTTMSIRRFINQINNTIVADEGCSCLPTWKFMDDESDELKRFVTVQNWFLDIFSHPYVENFLGQVQKIHIGQVFALSFESIIRMEDVIAEWNNSIPDELRLCADITNVDMCVTAIDKTTDCVLLLTFIHCQTFLVSIYPYLLHPVVLGKNQDELLSCVQQRSLENSLRACRLLIHAVHRISLADISTYCYYKLTACDFLFNVIDVLLLLSLSPNRYIAKESRIILNSCLEEASRLSCMHEYPTDNSPTFLKPKDFGDNVPYFNLEHYGQFPQPWSAMMYDASKYIASLQ